MIKSMLRVFGSLIITGIVLGCASISSTPCKSPVDFVKEVYSADGKTIEYALDPNIKYQSVRIEFFAKRGMTLRHNTTVIIQAPNGTIPIPDKVFIAPAQRWFNFVAVDQSGCSMWGLVNEVPLQKQGNIISIDIPTPGEGHAFVLK
ncbi:MAG: hypothetical protein C4522_20825 [Desulfobacteraceae bacterium]|nr:MAG: hypothetical protein C4522_20825 [Desulfobacteraceae bacterium]